MSTLDPMLGAIAREEVETVRRLARVKHALDERDSLFQRTPLMAAICWQSPSAAQLVDVLLSAGAEVDAVDRAGDSALGFAVIGRQTEIVRQLLAKGADPNQLTSLGWRMLNESVRRDKTGDITRLLLQHGADPHLSSKGKTIWERTQWMEGEGVKMPGIAILREWIAKRSR